jgi:DNA polymerase I-like protein with 3'-5' exonuclease and polymerase domains
MLAMHRCFPDVEKSLGHCVSYWTFEKFHKSEDSDGYFTRDQMIDRLRYCAKDVRTMFLVHKAISKFAKTIPGLEHSIETAMNSIKPYLVTSLQGIRYKSDDVLTTMKENDALMEQYMRCIRLLIGDVGMQEIASLCKKTVNKLSGFPGSNKQCCIYFHTILGYPVVARSKKTQEPSLAKQAMYKLALKHENPVIQFTLAFRKIQKEYGTLAFVPWKDDNGKIIIQPINTVEAAQQVQRPSGTSSHIVANDDASGG